MPQKTRAIAANHVHAGKKDIIEIELHAEQVDRPQCQNQSDLLRGSDSFVQQSYRQNHCDQGKERSHRSDNRSFPSHHECVKERYVASSSENAREKCPGDSYTAAFTASLGSRRTPHEQDERQKSKGEKEFIRGGVGTARRGLL